MATTWLVMSAVLVAVGAALTASSFRRKDSMRGLVGMTVTLVAAIPAAVYASITS